MLESLNYSQTTQDPVSKNRREHKRQKQIYFLICESCFWCASALSLRPIGNEITPKCPICNDDGISIVPISRGRQLWAYLTMLLKRIAILTAGDKNAYVNWSSNKTGNVEIMFSMKITRERLFLIALIATTILAVIVAPFMVHWKKNSSNMQNQKRHSSEPKNGIFA